MTSKVTVEVEVLRAHAARSHVRKHIQKALDAKFPVASGTPFTVSASWPDDAKPTVMLRAHPRLNFRQSRFKWHAPDAFGRDEDGKAIWNVRDLEASADKLIKRMSKRANEFASAWAAHLERESVREVELKHKASLVAAFAEANGLEYKPGRYFPTLSAELPLGSKSHWYSANFGIADTADKSEKYRVRLMLERIPVPGVQPRRLRTRLPARSSA